MRRTRLTVVVLLVLVPGVQAQGLQIDRHLTFEARPVAAGGVPKPLTLTSSEWRPGRADGALATAALRQQGPPQTPEKSWAYRHPVAVGFLVGAGAGAALGAAQCGPDSSCDYGRAAGAVQGALPLGLLGALTGWVVSLVRP